ncbi:hypothetical protein FOVG_17651 [Fusarium oxysporum f. sp. pisi HDV247]|uniref:Uncharacterized protein n=1 Tax=Fusarium oxysporum f. sp. pisi HDV247 TaxID=1080344 RepID=W9NE24_FUSOX|nr:hypothetical protein FOVG_17651 [Fusarium oxysporum f. sp. pisi HDV247]
MAGDTGEQGANSLTQGADFFGPQKPIDYIEPTEYERDFYFRKCEKFIFRPRGKALHKTAGSGEVLLRAHVGVTVIRGRSRAEKN